MHALFLRYLFLTTTTSKKTKPYFLSHHHLLLLLLLVTSLFFHSIEAGRFNVDPISFDEAYKPLFGDGNVVRHPDGQGVNLLLDRYTGAGFISSDMYDHGFFSAKIKLPGDYSAGIVVAFYTSNGDVFEKTHDELDIEFLGNIQARKWRFQTNLYGNGSTSRGREERYTLWFDPTRDFHRYSILWTANRIIFFVDEVPIREIVRNEAMGGDYPSKPMQLYATIWDGSDWATGGGKYKVNYKFAPFVAEFKDLVLEGCPVDPIEKVSSEDCSDDLSTLLFAKGVATISPAQRATMKRFRERYMYYSYCYDTLRYAAAPPECVIIPSEKERFKDTGRLKFGGSHKRRRRRQRHSRVASLSNDEAEVN